MSAALVRCTGAIHRVETPRVPIEVGTVVILRKRDSGMEFPAIVVAIVGSAGVFKLQWVRQDGQGRGVTLNKPARLDGKRHVIVGVYFDSAPCAVALRKKAGF